MLRALGLSAAADTPGRIRVWCVWSRDVTPRTVASPVCLRAAGSSSARLLLDITEYRALIDYRACGGRRGGPAMDLMPDMFLGLTPDLMSGLTSNLICS